jgi:vancomycin aglycone glucosyltransferase
MRVSFSMYGSRGKGVEFRATSPSAADMFRRVAELAAARFDTVAAAAEGCDALVATGVTPVGVQL